ncbi:MAG TPA: HEAT repeat domain-containing protein [Nitrospiraceae bacterium]|nr:HEAT repeat domain-containing protein [Nitrospiraceae bacterium]
MSDLKTAQDLMAAAMAAKSTSVDPELTSVIQLLKSLDRASKNVRTFGQSNSVAKKFFDQFYTELTTHLSQYDVLTFVIQREGLIFKEELVYRSQTGEASENFAFKLYSDGIREIAFHQDISGEDMLFFFDAMSGTVGAAGTEEEDDDIVTRLWEKNLPTLTIVTADEVMKISELDDVLAPQGKPPHEGSLREILAETNEKESTAVKEGRQRKPLFSSVVTGYEISELELATLANEIAVESSRDNVLYILDTLTAILSSERSPDLLNKLFEIYDGMLKSLIQEGRWSTMEDVLEVLSNADTIRPDLSEEHKRKIQCIFEQLDTPEIIGSIEKYLNTTDMPRTDGLPAIFLMMQPTAAPTLCTLLGNLEQPTHQALVVNALMELARNIPDIIVKHLSDRRPTFVRNLLMIITRWNNPRLGDSVEKILRYPDPLIRREVVRTLAALRSNGSATKLIPMLNDPDEGVRLATLKSLLTGNYSAPFSNWEPLINAETFGDRPPAERRNIFHAMRITTGDEAVPYWTSLLTEWGWTNRKKREELALMAIDALGKLGTPAAQVALETGAKKSTTAVKHACLTTLTGISKHSRTA